MAGSVLLQQLEWGPLQAALRTGRSSVFSPYRLECCSCLHCPDIVPHLVPRVLCSGDAQHNAVFADAAALFFFAPVQHFCPDIPNQDVLLHICRTIAAVAFNTVPSRVVCMPWLIAAAAACPSPAPCLLVLQMLARWLDKTTKYGVSAVWNWCQALFAWEAPPVQDPVQVCHDKGVRIQLPHQTLVHFWLFCKHVCCIAYLLRKSQLLVFRW